MTRVPGKYTPPCKNRSSKQYIKLTKMKPIVRSMSNEALQKISDHDSEAMKELNRRAKKNK